MSVEVSVSSETSPSTNSALPKFPSEGKELSEFPVYSIKALSMFAAKGLTKYIDSPIHGLNDLTHQPFVEDPNVTYIKQSNTVSLNQHKLHAANAYNLLIQSLNPKQIMLCQNIRMGNAFAVWRRLNENYGVIKSAASKHNLMQTLSDNIKLSSESVSDFFARTDRIIADIDAQSDNHMDDSTKRFHYIQGLSKDNKFSNLATLVSQVDSEEKWSLEKLKQYFINQYNYRVINPDHFSLPRRIFIGAILEF